MVRRLKIIQIIMGIPKIAVMELIGKFIPPPNKLLSTSLNNNMQLPINKEAGIKTK